MKGSSTYTELTQFYTYRQASLSRGDATAISPVFVTRSNVSNVTHDCEANKPEGMPPHDSSI